MPGETGEYLLFSSAHPTLGPFFNKKKRQELKRQKCRTGCRDYSPGISIPRRGSSEARAHRTIGSRNGPTGEHFADGHIVSSGLSGRIEHREWFPAGRQLMEAEYTRQKINNP